MYETSVDKLFRVIEQAYQKLFAKIDELEKTVSEIQANAKRQQQIQPQIFRRTSLTETN